MLAVSEDSQHLGVLRPRVRVARHRRRVPVLLFRRRSFSDSTPIEYCVSTYRADRYQLSMRLTVSSRG